MTNTALTADRLRELLSYDELAGVFTRRTTHRQWKSGTSAGTLCKTGYVYVGVDRQRYLAHRLAWLWVHGEFPAAHLDHINGNTADNRIANLRPANQSQNLQNRGCAQRNSKSGALGVAWDSAREAWRAEISTGGRRTFLGRFGSRELAEAAYAEAKRRQHTHHRHA